MKLLLDTHVWVWAFEGSDALGAKCRRALREKGNERFVSPVSTLKIARLVASGHIELACPLREWVARSMKALQLLTMPLDHAVAMEAYALPGEFHPDPADRILVATARVHACRLVTADRRILSCADVETLAAAK